MAVQDFLFGTAPKTKLSVAPTVTPEQATAYSSLLGNLTGGGGGSTPYPGALGVDLSGLEKTSLAGLERYAMDTASGATNQTLNNSNDALNQILQSGPQDIQDYFTQTVENPALRDFRENVQPAISRRFAPNNFYSSDRLRADDLAGRNLTENLTTNRSNIAYKAYQDNQANKLSALGLAPSIAGARGNILSQLLAAGGVSRDAALTNQKLNYDEFVRQQTAAEDKKKALIAALGIPQYENIAIQKGGSTGIAPSLASGVGAFLGGYFK